MLCCVICAADVWLFFVLVDCGVGWLVIGCVWLTLWMGVFTVIAEGCYAVAAGGCYICCG